MPFRRSSKPLGEQSPVETSLPIGNTNNRDDAAGARAGGSEETPMPLLHEMVEFHTNKNLEDLGNGKWKTHCPTVNHKDKNPSFHINDEMGHYGAYHCWGCGTHGGGDEFAREIMGKGSWQAATKEYLAWNSNGRGTSGPARAGQHRSLAAASAGRTVNSRNRTQTAAPGPDWNSDAECLDHMVKCIDMEQRMAEASRLFQDSLYEDSIIDGSSGEPLNTEAKNYLISRNFWKPDPAFKLGFFPPLCYSPVFLDRKKKYEKNSINSPSSFSGFQYLKNRIIFPWCDENGDVVGFTGRSIGAPCKGTPKYNNSKNSDIFKKSELLWGHHLAKDAIRDTKELFIVEGYTDVMSLHKAGIKQTVSPIGIAISEQQLDKIFRLNDHAIVCFDGDKAGRDASVNVAEKTLDYLNKTGLAAQGKSMSFALLPADKDPDEILREGGVRAFRKAVSKPLSLSKMINHDGSLEHQETEKQERSGGVAVGNVTMTQSAEGSGREARKRSAPAEQEHPQDRRKRQRLTSGLDL